MSFARDVYKRVERLLPDFYKNWIMQRMVYAGIKINYKEWIGFFFSYAVGFGLTAVLVSYLVFNLEWLSLIGIFFIVFFAINGLSELLLMLTIRSRTLFIEKILPDVISLIASNIKSGVTIDQALLLSTRDEFGSFKDALIKASKETLTGSNLGESLLSISGTIDSKLFKKTVALIIEGINSGGELSTLLENIAEDIRAMQLLKKEIKAGVSMYTLILVLASCLGAPLLFSISLYEVETLQSLLTVTAYSNIEIPSTISFMSFNPVILDINFLRIIAVICLLINTLFGSLMLGILQTGNSKDGVKTVPLLAGISLGVFLVSGYIIRFFFASSFV